MLRITMNNSAAGAKKYYCEQHHQEGNSAAFDYYGEGTQLIGNWGGQGAARLGLKGSIDKKMFARMCDNINPYTGRNLTRRTDSERTVGYDFTFNANKSVSLAYTFGSDADKKIILDAFQAAVRSTMNDVETGMQVRVRSNNRNENRLSGNLAYGEFTHFTTRPIDGVVDPHLHSHCFVFNASFDSEEEKWKAGQFRQIKQDAPYYEAIFYARLADNLQQAGYQTVRTKHGFELVGLEKSTLDKFSRRTQEIEDYAREHGITDDEQKSKIGVRTRKAKGETLSAARQEAKWQCRLTPEEKQAFKNLKRQALVEKDATAAEKAVQFALSHHLERKSVASDKEILASAIKAAVGQATPEQVKAAYQQQENIIAVNEQSRTFITTKEALQEEKQLIRQAIAARNRYRPIAPDYVPQNPLLNRQQIAAVNHALSSTDGIILITGKAGTGKTTLMKEVQNAIRESGKAIFAFAPSSEASRGVQRSEGFDNAETVARLIQNTNMHSELKNHVIWVDEAGMLSNKDMNKLLGIANSQSARIILSGDTKQHSAVERGDALRIIQQESGIPAVTVDKIQRQLNSDYQEAVQSLSDGNVERGFKKLDKMGAIHEMPETQERLKAVAQDYVQTTYHSGPKAKEVLVVAPTHAEGSAVTEKIREELKEQQLIGAEDRIYTTLQNRQLTEAEKKQPENYHPGDWVIFHQNTKGIKAGSRFEVQDVKQEEVFIAGRDQALNLVEAKKFSLFEPKETAITEGDKLRITANGKSEEGKHLFNSSVFQVEGFTESGQIQLSNGSTLAPDFGHFNLGYVSTSHGSQGKTADKVIISQSSATFNASSMEQFYVSVSRGREAVSIYTDDKEQMFDAVSHSSERKTATELVATQKEQQITDMQRVAVERRLQQQTAPPSSPQPINQQLYGLQTAARTEQNQHAR